MSNLATICGDYARLEPLVKETQSTPAAVKARLDEKLGSAHWRPISQQVCAAAGAAETGIDPERAGALPAHLRIDDGAVVISPDRFASMLPVEQAVRSLIPWRKGPFKIGGLAIDAEWRSDLKWERIVSALLEPGADGQQPADLDQVFSGKKILDIGCNNGYYLYRMLQYSPAAALGIDPAERCLLQFALLNLLIGSSAAAVLPLGVEELNLFAPVFDLVFCLGVTYHRKDPLEALQRIGAVLAPGGMLVLESLVLADGGENGLVPADRYAKMRNVYLVPGVIQLCRWLKTAGFRNIKPHAAVKTTPEEQRSTAYSPGESLSDFLDPDNSELTVEGYPAPQRVIVTANR